MKMRNLLSVCCALIISMSSIWGGFDKVLYSSYRAYGQRPHVYWDSDVELYNPCVNWIEQISAYWDYYERPKN